MYLRRKDFIWNWRRIFLKFAFNSHILHIRIKIRMPWWPFKCWLKCNCLCHLKNAINSIHSRLDVTPSYWSWITAMQFYNEYSMKMYVPILKLKQRILRYWSKCIKSQNNGINGLRDFIFHKISWTKMSKKKYNLEFNLLRKTYWYVIYFKE